MTTVSPLFQITITLADSASAGNLSDKLEEAFSFDEATISTYAVIEDGPWAVDLFCHGISLSKAQWHLKPHIAEAGLNEKDLQISQVADIDWVAYSLKDLPPVQLGRWFIHGRHNRHEIKPWHRHLEIEAAQAFGTGHHATTIGCLKLFDHWSGQHSANHILDLGTGTGILAMAAAHRLRCNILASDIDPIAIKAAKANIIRNKLQPWIHTIVASGTPNLRLSRQPYDLIFANILARPLMALAFDIAAAVKPKGHIILSGLTQADKRRILARYQYVGFAPLSRYEDGNWVSFLLKKR